jgi:N-acetylmuramoyl-L-alanine amidase
VEADLMDYASYSDVDLVALAIWREARGEGNLGRRGVGWVIKNRASEGGWWGNCIRGVILKPYQFSSFNRLDPNSNKVPLPVDRSWVECQQIAASVLGGTDTDITNGAQFYHDISISFPQTWGNRDDFTRTLCVGRLIFYRYQPILSSNNEAVSDAAQGAN